MVLYEGGCCIGVVLLLICVFVVFNCIFCVDFCVVLDVFILFDIKDGICVCVVCSVMYWDMDELLMCLFEN